MPTFEPCQFFNILGEHPLKSVVWHEFRRNMGIRTVLRRYFGGYRVGDSSRYEEGQWVRILDKEELQKTLDSESKLRGLLFLPYMWQFCGGTYEVQRVMRGIIDDQGVFRKVTRTILLDGIDCNADPAAGCGRGCPLMFRDEWVQPASKPASEPKIAGTGADHWVRVRSAKEIQATLDKQGKRDGLLFMPEMYRWVGRRLRVLRQVERAFEYETYVPPHKPIYILEGLRCSGAVLGKRGLCDRNCSLLWHSDWLTPDDGRAS